MLYHHALNIQGTMLHQKWNFPCVTYTTLKKQNLNMKHSLPSAARIPGQKMASQQPHEILLLGMKQHNMGQFLQYFYCVASLPRILYVTPAQPRIITAPSVTLEQGQMYKKELNLQVYHNSKNSNQQQLKIIRNTGRHT